MTIIGGLVIFWLRQTGYPESVEHLLVGSYKLMALGMPLIAVSLTALLWFFAYKNDEGHLAAFVLGWLLLMPALSSSVSESINGQFYSDKEELFFWYVGLSHIMYGLLNAKEVLEGLGKDGY
ncbi:MAG: hypothetical protein GY931_08795 [Maribacter sp.]|nr:hypothetical protein [Maribacter sp.]